MGAARLDDRRRDRPRSGDRLGAAQRRRRARPRRRRSTDGRRSSCRRVHAADPGLGDSTVVSSSPSMPRRRPAPPTPTPGTSRLVDDIEAAGATVVVEHGVVTGEVRGLEVCRVVDSRLTATAVRLEVGVGPHDREAFAIIHGDVPAPRQRSPVSWTPWPRPAHWMRQDTRSTGWHRSGCCAGVSNRSRGSSGWRSVRPAEPPVPRRGLKHAARARQSGQRLDGSAGVIVCSVGVDLDVIPYAADARLAAGVGAEREDCTGGDPGRPSGTGSPTGDHGAGGPARSLRVVGRAVGG